MPDDEQQRLKEFAAYAGPKDHRSYVNAGMDDLFRVEMRKQEQQIRGWCAPFFLQGYRVEELDAVMTQRGAMIGARVVIEVPTWKLRLRRWVRKVRPYHPEWTRDEDGMPLDKKEFEEEL